MHEKLFVRDIMTPAPHTISFNEKIIAAKRLMNQHSIRHIPVTEKGALVGILSDRDIKLAEALSKKRSFNDEVAVKEVCVFDPYIVEEDADLGKVLSVLAKKRFGSALVTRNGRLTGIITMIDVCRAFASFLKTK